MAAAGPAKVPPTQAVGILSAFVTSRCSDQLQAILLERDLNAHYAVKIECVPATMPLHSRGRLIVRLVLDNTAPSSPPFVTARCASSTRT